MFLSLLADVEKKRNKKFHAELAEGAEQEEEKRTKKAINDMELKKAGLYLLCVLRELCVKLLL